jgi:hypothetical protein
VTLKRTHTHDDTVFHKSGIARPCSLLYANSLFPHCVTRVSPTSYETATKESEEFRVVTYSVILVCYMEPQDLSLLLVFLPPQRVLSPLKLRYDSLFLRAYEREIITA